MARKLEKNLIVALDIGTSKIASLVAEVAADNSVEIVGFGCHPSYGLKRGVVVNIESTVRSIQRAIEEAELMAGCKIQSAYAGIAGSHIFSLNSHGIVAIRDREVTQSDIDRVIDAAKAIVIPADQRILHILPQEFIIDNQTGVREPIGMSGVRLEARVHIVTGAVSASQNITKCILRCDLQLEDIVLEQLASSHAVLTEDEKELGICMVDIGGGTTDIAVFSEGAIRYTSVIPIAGDHVTNDVAIALRMPRQYAEQIKVKYGSVLPDSIEPTEMIKLPVIAYRESKQLNRRALAEVIAARYGELFSLVLMELRKNGFEHLMSAGLVLTGGAAKVAGILELAGSVFDMPVRIGVPQNVNGLMDVRHDPVFATSVGLLLHGQRQCLYDSKSYLDTSIGGLWSRMKAWFADNF